MNRLLFFVSVFAVICTSTVIRSRRCTCLEEKVDCSFLYKSQLLADELCVNVSKIDLSFNDFTSYPDGLQYFQLVDMTANQLTRLPSPSELHPEIELLDLSYNMISNTSNELQILSHLILLYVSGNEITSLDFLPDHCNIWIFEGSHCTIRRIESLRRCNLLKTLTLDRNKIKKISSGVFEGMSELIAVSLKDNPLEVITPGALRGLTSLKFLYLSNCHITELADGIFSDVPRLQILDLSRNKISTMSGNVFAGLDHIVEICLKSNNITELPILNNSNCCSSLTQIDFLRNGISNPSETAVRSYLRAGSSILDLEVNPVQPAALRWALDAPDLTPFAKEDDPNCGELRSEEKTRVKFCVAIENPYANWIAIVRQSAPS